MHYSFVPATPSPERRKRRMLGGKKKGALATNIAPEPPRNAREGKGGGFDTYRHTCST